MNVNNNEWDDLIDRHLCGELNESEKERLAELLDSDPSVRKDLVEQTQWETRVAEVLRDGGESCDALSEPIAAGTLRRAVAEQANETGRVPAIFWAAVATTIIALIAAAYLYQGSGPRPIAKITGLSGTLQWTGDGGQVFHDLAVGTELSGGTIDGMSPDCWFELEFDDGSIVVISGNSMLTFSDLGQKKLHLKGGSFSANVVPQPKGKPMLIHTRSAMLEVLGTRFDVEAGLSSTFLNVSEGKVRVKRLSDGSSVDVPAKHRVIAAADREMSPVRVPDSVGQWRSQLHRGPDKTYGRWSPGTEGEDAKLKAIPHTTELGKTIYTASLQVAAGDSPPVVLRPNSSIRVRGRIASPQKVYFGLTVRHASGDFAGRFQTIRPADEFQSGQEFEVVLALRDYGLDPSLDHMKNKLPSDPFDLIVETMWCHTLNEPAGLEVAEVELLPAVGAESE